MSKGAKIWLTIALILLACGLVFVAILAANDWDIAKIGTTQYETNTHAISESFRDISMDTDTADIVFVPAQDDTSTVVCFEPSNAQHTVAVKDGTLVIESVDNRRWYERIFSFAAPKITLTIPQGEYGVLSIDEDTGDVEIPKPFRFERMDLALSTGSVKSAASALESINVAASTGNIRLENASAAELDLSVSTGEITLTDVTCKGSINTRVSTGQMILTNVTCQNVISDGSTGEIFLKNVVAGEKLSLERSTGDIRLDGVDAAEIFIETDTGDVTGTLLSEKVFIAEADTGKVRVPKTTSGGKCEISTSTGDIHIRIE
ncbi:MAG: DUF4097 family beta strand repeat protein [Clostridia bacterium]|nr:DUF4097 family beta strand repeat protein [Clostridia bacterium]